MRVNCYAEEITEEAEAVHTVADTGRTFYGVRLFLKSSEALDNTPSDDDRSAITLWVPWSAANGHEPAVLRRALMNMLKELESVPEGMDH